MSVADLLHWLETTSLADQIRESLLLFPMLESFHVIGLALVFGTILVIDLRLLGVASSERPFERVAADILTWTWLAFALTAVTGALMFSTNATVYYNNLYFRLKMLLLVLAAVNMAAFEVTARKTVKQWDSAPSAPPAGRKVAIASIVIWLGVIFAGRMIGFTATRTTTLPAATEELNLDDLFETAPAATDPAAGK
jgi:hypothetical protein